MVIRFPEDLTMAFVEVRSRLSGLRARMKRAGVDAYYVPSTDPHQSEYVPSWWQRRRFMSGFTGSAGDLLVTRAQAGLWTDSRYFLQATQELQKTGIQLFKAGLKGVPTVTQWLQKNLKKGQKLGVDPRLLSRAELSEFEGALGKAGAQLKLLEENLVDAVWEDRPEFSRDPIEVLPLEFAGETAISKLKRLREMMAEAKAAAHVVTTTDAVAWLFNIRGNDVLYNPVAVAYAVVTPSKATLYIHPEKVPAAVKKALGKVELKPYEALGKDLQGLARKKAVVWVDGRTTNAWVVRKLSGCPLITDPSPIYRMKARKNPVEVAGMIAAHKRDGRAMVRALAWLDRTIPGSALTELDIGRKLLELRSVEERFRGESFGTIAGFGEHGAIVHYESSPETNVALQAGGILLIDSGGQYRDGTTDITRTVLLGGQASAQQKEDFTRVLKGHISIARLSFPAGTAGRQIDAFARRALWESGYNYGHGTGHGVGMYLSVHEGPQAISPARCTGVPLEEGNILSDEPGVYREGQYGIRIEALVLVERDDALSQRSAVPFLKFRAITLCPIDLRLVEPSLLAPEEREWLNAYHRRVREELSPALDAQDADWLANATRAI
jgi:Xaa-Pro aminopeptidase